jgi:hypothetical protein
MERMIQRFDKTSTHALLNFSTEMVLQPGFDACMQPGSSGRRGHASRVDLQSLGEFGKFLKVDLGLAKKTVWRYVYEMEKFFGCCEKQPITRVVLRDYLEPLEVEPRNTALKAFRRFFRDFVERESLSAPSGSLRHHQN